MLQVTLKGTPDEPAIVDGEKKAYTAGGSIDAEEPAAA
jgi:hypothetical protein